MRTQRIMTGVMAAVALAACDGDTTTAPPVEDGSATVIGRVETTAATGLMAKSTAAPSGASARTVAVAEITADGSVQTLATADVQADGTFRVEGVPTGRADLQVIAYDAGDADVGRVLVHERTRADVTITTAPINTETTLEARAWARVKARGEANATSTAEVALLTRMDVEGSARVPTEAEFNAVADGMAEAGQTMTAVFAGSSATSLDADTRADLYMDAVLQFAADRHAGASLEAAHEAFTEASLDALVGAGADAETLVMATAGATTTLDAAFDADTEARTSVTAQAVRMNLRARERLAGRLEGSQVAVAGSVVQVLAEARADLRGATTAAEIRNVLDVSARSAADLTVAAMVDLLVPAGNLPLRSAVEAAARAVVADAALEARLRGVASANSAAQAMANYRSAVRAAVDAMLETAGVADADAEAMTALFIAANGGGYLR